jgi:glycine oxidase
LEASARELIGERFAVVEQAAGVRVNLPDKRPAVGRHPQQARLGLVNGLGAKGVLWAPWLAAAWVANLRDGVAFPMDADVGRFG